MNLKEILHILAEGISLTGTAREELHQAIDEHDAQAAAPAEAEAGETKEPE